MKEEGEGEKERQKGKKGKERREQLLSTNMQEGEREEGEREEGEWERTRIYQCKEFGHAKKQYPLPTLHW